MSASAETPCRAMTAQLSASSPPFTFSPSYVLCVPSTIPDRAVHTDHEIDNLCGSLKGSERTSGGYPSSNSYHDDKQETPGSLRDLKAQPALREQLTSNNDQLDLWHVAASENADKLVEVVAAAITNSEKRKTKRRDKSIGKLRKAVEAILGGLLIAKLWHGAVPCRAMGSAGFEGCPLTRHIAQPVFAALDRMGFIKTYPGFRLIGISRVTRFVVLSELVTLAAQHGITRDTVRTDFQERDRPRAVKVPKLVVLRELPPRCRRRARVTRSEIVDLSLPDTDRHLALTAAVQRANGLLTRHQFEGCAPPALRRLFAGSFDLGGRLYGVGIKNFQTIKKADRAAIRVDGQPLAQIDVRAAHLSIACAAVGHPMVGDDPYAVPSVERDIVKAFVVAVFGNGAVPRRWPVGLLSAEQALRAGPIAGVAQAVCSVYPFLEKPSEALAGPLGLDTMGHIGTPKDLLALRLQAIEAEGLGAALQDLWAADIPALPLHDAVLVPAPYADIAEQAMRRAFEGVCGIPKVLLKLGFD